MKLNKYNNYDAYKKAQVEANKMKLDCVWVQEETIQMISDYIKEHCSNAKRGICHGTRRGVEQKWFKESLQIDDVIGTEISDTASRFPDTIQWDFHDVKDEWVDDIDFIYSNSFDHSYDPPKALDQWMKCVKKDGGMCFIEWTKQNDEDHTSKWDCFGASVKEYKEMIQKKYVLKDVLERKSERRGKHFIFVVSHPSIAA